MTTVVASHRAAIALLYERRNHDLPIVGRADLDQGMALTSDAVVVFDDAHAEYALHGVARGVIGPLQRVIRVEPAAGACAWCGDVTRSCLCTERM